MHQSGKHRNCVDGRQRDGDASGRASHLGSLGREWCSQATTWRSVTLRVCTSMSLDVFILLAATARAGRGFSRLDGASSPLPWRRPHILPTPRNLKNLPSSHASGLWAPGEAGAPPTVLGRASSLRSAAVSLLVGSHGPGEVGNVITHDLCNRRWLWRHWDVLPALSGHWHGAPAATLSGHSSCPVGWRGLGWRAVISGHTSINWPGSERTSRRHQGKPWPCPTAWASLLAQLVKNPPAMQETQVGSLGREGTLEKERATHSSTLAWKTPGTPVAWRATVHGVARGRHHWATKPPPLQA